MEISLSALPVDGANPNRYRIDFTTLGAAYTAAAPDGGFPLFDIEGQEYIYFVMEQYIGSSVPYRSFSEYATFAPGQEPSWYNDRIATGILFNGGTLFNRRVGSADIDVTKEWIAAARQSMNADVTVLVERRVAANTVAGRPAAGGWERVPATELYPPPPAPTTGAGEYVLSGFRAEVMEITQSIGNLPRFVRPTDIINGNPVNVNLVGAEYEYQISEHRILIDGVSRNVLPTDSRIVVDGYTYELSKKTTLNGTPPSPPDAGVIPGATGGEVEFTNKLVGNTEINIRKIWNGSHRTELPYDDWGTVYFRVTRADGVPIVWNNAQNPVTVTIDGQTRSVPTACERADGNTLYIEGDDA